MMRIHEFTKNHFLRQASNSIKGRLAFNISWSLIGAILSRSLLLIANILFARILGPTLLGEVGIIQSTVSVFCVIASSGVALGVTKFVAEVSPQNKRDILGYIKTGLILEISLGSMGVCALLILSSFISKDLSSTTDISLKLISFAFTTFFISVNNVQIAALSGLEKFQTIALINVIRGSLILIFGVLGSFYFSVFGILIGLECAEMITMVISQIFLRKSLQLLDHSGFIQKNEWQFRKLINFGAPSMGSSVVTMASFWYCNYLLTQSNGFEAMGIFNAAEKWKQILIFIPTAISPTILPVLSNLLHDHHNYVRVFRTNLFISLIVLIFPAGMLLLLADSAMSIYGHEFVQGKTVLTLLVLSSIFSVLNNIFSHVLISLGLTPLRLAFDLVLSAVVLICSTTLIPSFGTEGLAFSHLLGFFVTSFLIYLVIKNKLRKLNGNK